MDGKVWYLSKSIWVGLITLIWGLLQYFGVVDQALTPETLATVLGVVIVILRFVTKKPIELQKR